MKILQTSSLILLIVGLMIVVSPLLVFQNALTDATKGFTYGAGIGCLLLSLFLQTKQNNMVG